jgi:hypothetical protein
MKVQVNHLFNISLTTNFLLIISPRLLRQYEVPAGIVQRTIVTFICGYVDNNPRLASLAVMSDVYEYMTPPLTTCDLSIVSSATSNNGIIVSPTE